MESNLIWTEKSKNLVFKNRIFSIRESLCVSPSGKEGIYTAMESPDWAVVIPVLETPQGREFVMVRQWRHGARDLSLEFPGGVFEPQEDGALAAGRELQEETGYTPGKILKLGEMSPNPAIMANHSHFFLAQDLENTGKQHLDEDEYLDVELVKAEEVIRLMGKPPYIHALMASALLLYLQKVPGS
jgi:8-oxo-dGTP pyrophosphatase MutT (NUDIX family)